MGELIDFRISMEDDIARIRHLFLDAADYLLMTEYDWNAYERLIKAARVGVIKQQEDQDG